MVNYTQGNRRSLSSPNYRNFWTQGISTTKIKKTKVRRKALAALAPGALPPYPRIPTASVLIRMKGITPLHSGRGFKCVRAPNPRSRHNFCGRIYCAVCQHQAPYGCPVLPASPVSCRPRLAVASRFLQGWQRSYVGSQPRKKRAAPARPAFSSAASPRGTVPG